MFVFNSTVKNIFHCNERIKFMKNHMEMEIKNDMEMEIKSVVL